VKDNLGSEFFNRPDARCTRIYTGSDIRETAGVIGEVGTTIVRADIYIVYIYIYKEESSPRRETENLALGPLPANWRPAKFRRRHCALALIRILLA